VCEQVEIDDCVFFNCVSDSEGGVIYAEDSKFSVSNCDIYKNFADDKGGVISAYNSKVNVWNCNISANKCNEAHTSDGGALYLYESEAVINSCMIANNYANLNGGGMSINYSEVEIGDCRILNNTAGTGAGIHSSQSNCIIDNCEIFNNSALGNYGGGLYFVSLQTLEIYNSTIANNHALVSGGGIYLLLYDDTHIYNSIINGNTVKTSTPQDLDGDFDLGQVSLFNSCISNHVGSTANVNLTNCVRSNPEFVNTSEESLTGTIEFTRLSNVVTGTDSHFTDELQVGDNIYLVVDGEDKALCVKEIISDTELVLVSLYLADAIYPGAAKAQKNHLELQRKSDGDAKDSPCIDAGDNQYVNSSVDLLGNQRIVDGNSDSQAVVDMGARETEKQS